MISWILLAVVNAKVNRVLVIGATGRVGSQVVSRLITRGIDTNILVRDADTARSNPLLKGATVFEGDVNSIEDLSKSSEMCSAVIAVHGMKPPRFTSLTDLFAPISWDPNHPYNVNYLAIKKLLAVMEKNNVNKLVRVTGALTARSPFNLFVSLFNLILSFTVKWQEMAEIAIRRSKIDYTIIRPPGIRDMPSCADHNAAQSTPQLELYLYDESTASKYQAGPAVISKEDVAELCVLGVVEPALSQVSAIVGSRPGSGPSTWTNLLASQQVMNISSIIMLYKQC